MPTDVRTLVLVLVAFQVKHFIADFLLQNEWTIKGKEREHDWLAPLMAHAFGHAALTLFIALVFNTAFWWLGPVDLLIHAVIDRGKGVAGRRLSAEGGGRLWWQIFGLDQTLHHLTHLGYAVVIVLY
jgi:Protein of unknown function (DUF3307)